MVRLIVLVFCKQNPGQSFTQESTSIAPSQLISFASSSSEHFHEGFAASDERGSLTLFNPLQHVGCSFCPCLHVLHECLVLINGIIWVQNFLGIQRPFINIWEELPKIQKTRWNELAALILLTILFVACEGIVCQAEVAFCHSFY